MIIKIILVFALVNYILSFINKKQGIAACGLIGFSGQTEFNLDKIKFLMFWNSVYRGRDATGIFTPRTGIIKMAESAEKFLNHKDLQKLKEDTCLIGHVRAKTVGNNIGKNAHPFHKGNTILAHNGTLTDIFGEKGLAKQYGMEYKDYDVDSEILAVGVNKAFNSKDEEFSIPILSDYQGAAALIFYNEKTDHLYVYHDKERPLFRGWDSEGNMYMSSIAEALEAIECFAIEPFAINTLFTIRGGQIQSEVIYKTYEELHPKPVVEITHSKSRKALRREANSKITKPKKGERGFTEKNVKPQDLVGFWLRAKYTMTPNYNYTGVFSNHAKVQANRWYLVTGWFESDAKWVEIIDESGRPSQINTTNLDVDNYIPIVDDGFKFFKPCRSERTKEIVFEKDDIALVTGFDFEEGCVKLHSVKTNSVWSVPTSFGRLIKSVEEEEVKAPTCEVELTTPFIDFGEHEIIQPEADEDTPVDNNTQEDFIAMEIYTELVSFLISDVDELEQKYMAEVDITPNINEIRAKLRLSTDPLHLKSYEMQN